MQATAVTMRLHLKLLAQLRSDPLSIYLKSKIAFDANEINYLYSIYDKDGDMALTLDEVVNSVLSRSGGTWSCRVSKLTVERDIDAVIENLKTKYGQVISREQFHKNISAVMGELSHKLIYIPEIEQAEASKIGRRRSSLFSVRRQSSSATPAPASAAAPARTPVREQKGTPSSAAAADVESGGVPSWTVDA